mmetsp:Transcript_58994/g.140867  ORF Transcript_58994/g.140867 Transcript_58994/m.140867 type:complete len:372 (-) Transcript_58994:103-1218(-)
MLFEPVAKWRHRCKVGGIALVVVAMQAMWMRPRCSVTRAFIQRAPSLHPDQPSLKIISWNVNGVRSFLKDPAKQEALSAMLEAEQPDITFLQEHRLQEKHVAKEGRKFERFFDAAMPDRGPHTGVWACSTARGGYSGSCAIFHENAGNGIVHHAWGEVDDNDRDEGRTVRLDLACGLSVVGSYTPNAMSELKRLDYRINGWDRSMQRYLKELESRGEGNGQPWNVILCGDLNVAHRDVDFYNSESKATLKQPGTTLEERESFTQLLEDLDMSDAWRCQHPTATRAFTFWSARQKARLGNRGMRLDYFVVSNRMLPSAWRLNDRRATTTSASLRQKPAPQRSGGITVHDTAILHEVLGSDHCPVACTLLLPI